MGFISKSPAKDSLQLIIQMISRLFSRLNFGQQTHTAMADETEKQETVEVKKEVSEVSIQCVFTIDKPDKVEEKCVADDDLEFLYKPPRLFRKSIIHKTWKLFKDDEELGVKSGRKLSEK